MLLPSRLRLLLPLALGVEQAVPPSTAKTVLFIRHGESAANVAGPPLYGTDVRDAPLTGRGRAQTASWSQTASSWNVQKVFCSPLVRSIESAANILSLIHI